MQIEPLKEYFLTEIKNEDLKNGQILWPIRVALTGEKFSPGALEMMIILGKEKSLERLNRVLG